jgi:hypothetical protein
LTSTEPSPATCALDTVSAPELLDVLDVLVVLGLLELLPQPATARVAPTTAAALSSAVRPL